jgi:hypothetical protein
MEEPVPVSVPDVVELPDTAPPPELAAVLVAVLVKAFEITALSSGRAVIAFFHSSVGSWRVLGIGLFFRVIERARPVSVLDDFDGVVRAVDAVDVEVREDVDPEGVGVAEGGTDGVDGAEDLVAGERLAFTFASLSDDLEGMVTCTKSDPISDVGVSCE